MKTLYLALKNALTEDPHIVRVSASRHRPTNIGSNTSSVDWDGKDLELNPLMTVSWIDFDYVETMKIEMLEGRNFSREYTTDVSDL